MGNFFLEVWLPDNIDSADLLLQEVIVPSVTPLTGHVLEVPVMFHPIV